MVRSIGARTSGVVKTTDVWPASVVRSIREGASGMVKVTGVWCSSVVRSIGEGSSGVVRAAGVWSTRMVRSIGVRPSGMVKITSVRSSSVVRSIGEGSTSMVKDAGMWPTSVMRSIGERPSRVMKPSGVRTSSVMRCAGVVGSSCQVRSAGVVWCADMVRRFNVSTVSYVTVSGGVSEAITIRPRGVTEATGLPVTVATATVGEGAVASSLGRRQIRGCVVAFVSIVARSRCGRAGNLVKELVSPAVTAGQPPCSAAGEKRSFDYEED